MSCAFQSLRLASLALALVALLALALALALLAVIILLHPPHHPDLFVRDLALGIFLLLRAHY